MNPATTDIVLKAIVGFRWLSAIIAFYNLTWSFSGARDFARGYRSPPPIYLSVVFWFSIATLEFWVTWVVNAPVRTEMSSVVILWRLLSYVLLTLAMALAAYGNKVGSALKATKFYLIYDHLDLAFSLIDLWRVDQAAAEKIAADCRQLTASALLNNPL